MHIYVKAAMLKTYVNDDNFCLQLIILNTLEFLSFM